MAELIERLRAALEGRYAVQRELGAGGMAIVFLAEDLKHQRPVAIKVLSPELAAAIGPERFLREIGVVGRLQHPHILPLHDSGEADGLLYYVMPYVEGESLRARLEREAQLPITDALRLATQVASALDYAHRQGVVHRDIKPDNILLADGQAVVADFGIARAIVAAEGSKLTASGVTVGTPMYMSPEQVARGGAVDGRSDLYSLACVLYEMLGGQPPFTGPTGEVLVHQHVNVAPRPVRALRPSVTEAVDQALAVALSKAPADRFKTASDFAAAIATPVPVASGSSVGRDEGATPGTGQYGETSSDEAAVRPVGAPRRRRLLLAASAVIVTGLALAGWWFGPWRHGDRGVVAKPRAWMLVAEFDGPDADSSLTKAVRDLAIAGLEESEVVAVVPSDQIQVALRRADKPASTRVDAEVARELAYRSAVRTVLEGRIGRLGQGFSVVLRVVDVDSARVVVTVSDVARDEAALIPTLSRVMRRLRAEVGERRAAIQATRELADVVTPSLEAFKEGARARALLLSNDQRGAIEAARSALEHDPEFPWAWAAKAFAFSNLGEADSAVFAFQRALEHREKLTEGQRLVGTASIAFLNGDIREAVVLSERVTKLRPESPGAHNNLGAYLFSVGRYEDALESYRRAVAVSPFGPNPQILSNQFQLLLVLGRLDEARQVGSRFTGSLRLGAPMWLAAAGGEWAAAESLASTLRNDADAYGDLRLEAEWILAAALASRGQVRAADQALRAVQTRSEFASDPLNVNRTRWRRLMLALFCEGVAAAPGEPGHWDSTTTGLVTRGAWEAAAGDTVAARRLLETVRGRSTPDRARQGPTLQLLQGWIAAREGRWQEALEVAGPAGMRGESMGFSVFQAAPLTRWLVAEAYEHLGQPDSAAAYFERAIALPPAGGSDFAHTRMASAFGHRRLALLYARMGRADEARDHWERFIGMMSSPDPEMAPLVQEARAALAGGGGSSKSAIR